MVSATMNQRSDLGRQGKAGGRCGENGEEQPWVGGTGLDARYGVVPVSTVRGLGSPFAGLVLSQGKGMKVPFPRRLTQLLQLPQDAAVL